VPLRRLSNGSFPSVLGTPAENVRYGQARAARQPLPGPPARHPVRIIEYTLTVRAPTAAARVEPFRLVTSLLDPDAAPAADLAALYQDRGRANWATASRRPGYAARRAITARDRVPVPKNSCSLGPRIKW